MSKIDEIRAEMVTAMKNRDKERKETLSMLLAALKNKAIDKRADLTEAEEFEVIKKEIKQTKETMELAPADREDSCIQRFYLYLAMKKPRQSLCISYSRSDMQGKQRKPSPALADIREEAERSGRSLVRQERPPEGIFREEEGLLTLAGAFSAGRYEDRQVQTLYNLLRRRGFGAQAERLLRASAFCRREEKLDRETALSLYGETLYGSVTRLEQYGKCPFSHFLRYGLVIWGVTYVLRLMYNKCKRCGQNYNKRTWKSAGPNAAICPRCGTRHTIL